MLEAKDNAIVIVRDRYELVTYRRRETSWSGRVAPHRARYTESIHFYICLSIALAHTEPFPTLRDQHLIGTIRRSRIPEYSSGGAQLIPHNNFLPCPSPQPKAQVQP